MSERHFHEQAQCLHCFSRRDFSTPILDVLIMAEHCQHCFFAMMVGRDEHQVCEDCRRQLAAVMAAR